MDKKDIKKLLERYLADECTDAERAIVEDWYNRQHSEAPHDIPAAEIEADIAAIKKELPQPSARRRFVNLRYHAAAAIVIIGIGVWIVQPRFFNKLEDAPLAVIDENDILPGGNRALLTLADGTAILLDDKPVGKIAQEGNNIVYKNADGELVYRRSDGPPSEVRANEFHRITTPRGGQCQLTLPDGSQVWLNAESAIRFSANNSGDERIVELTGEAYFEVARDANRPFKVITGKQVIEVLGTHFNVNSYPNEPVVRTTLVEGSVKVSEKSETRSVVLKPGQQASIGDQRRLTVHDVSVADAIAWKNGMFSFNDSNIESIMRQLSRWYDVEVEFEGNKPEFKLWGEVYRNVKASEALEILSFFNLNYRIETVNGVKKIVISG
ncbi:protein of unknown function [Parapedobacter composti]|uniref:FecR protein n=1 Tax=Parapedobacter composti TaxID=623281 RepID=A0A1I1FM66_9SPHI|nr:FecR family protein [Parapedobacter composti]SFC00371.1 protein of unknown function [Parapedobacter composti]